MEEYKWDLPKSLKRLFNYCFPPNFRLKEQQKLDLFKQGSQRVRSYAAELKNMYQIIGYAHKREKVRKLWNGLQEKLFENKYDPERSKWGEIVDAAEMYEIAREMGLGDNRRDHKGNKHYGCKTSGSRDAVNNEKSGNTNGTNSNHKEREQSYPGKGSNKSNHRNKHNKDKRTKPKSSKLSEAEIERYKNKGLRFKCGQKGHISNNCSDNDKVASSGSGPPGVRSNQISFSLSGTGDLKEAREVNLRASGACIQLAANRFGNIEVKKVPRGRKNWRRTRMGGKRTQPPIRGKLGNL
ncbi:hypothetical protein C0995_004860, partial [Termitomyces sp. Mi166